MKVWVYLNLGKELHDTGYETDGCTFIGWLIHMIWGDKFDNACWSHDFARRELIPVDDQSENDNLFKDALKELGAPRPLRFAMYFFTKTQGWFKDNLNMSLNAFLGFLFFIAMVATMFYLAIVVFPSDAEAAPNDNYIVFLKWKTPAGDGTGVTGRADGTPLASDEIIGYQVYIDQNRDGSYTEDVFYKMVTGLEEQYYTLAKSVNGSPCFYVTTLDDATPPRESIFSKPFCFSRPNPPAVECRTSF